MHGLQDAACSRPLIGETPPFSCHTLLLLDVCIPLRCSEACGHIVCNAGVILRDSEDVNTRASALEILLLISDDNFTAQTVSVCLDAASLKDCDVGGPDLLRCQFRKLVDKLAEHSAESQNIAPKVPTASSSSTLSWVPAAGGTCGLQEKATNDETDRSTDGGHYTGSIVSQSVRQDKVLQGKLLQDSIPLCTHEGQQPSRGTPSLPALPPSLLFSAPPQATQVHLSCLLRSLHCLAPQPRAQCAGGCQTVGNPKQPSSTITKSITVQLCGSESKLFAAAEAEVTTTCCIYIPSPRGASWWPAHQAQVTSSCFDVGRAHRQSSQVKIECSSEHAGPPSICPHGT